MTFRFKIAIIALTAWSTTGFSQDLFSSLDPLEPISQSTVSIDGSLKASEIAPFTMAQMIPAYRTGLKKGMFEFQTGVGHIEATKASNRDLGLSIKKEPRTDFIPFQVAYGIGNTTNLSISGKFSMEQDKVSKSNHEGPTEPQITLTQILRNNETAILLSGTYTPDMGAQTNKSMAASRTEGNSLSGGASYEFTGGGFSRLESVIIGGEASYLYRDTRTVNRETIALFSGASTGVVQTKIEGGHEKTLRGIVEVIALPTRFGLVMGRTWVEQEEELQTNSIGFPLYDSYAKDFIGAYARFQLNPKFSILPLVTYKQTAGVGFSQDAQDQELLTQVNLRYRF